jgi:type II secretory pathway component PulF
MFAPKISLKAAEQFCGRFATALKAGIDPLKLLDSESRMVSRRHQEAAAAVRARLVAGDTLAEAMKYRSDYFPKLLTQMVEAGEHAGGLDRTFAYMSKYYRDLRETRGSFIKQITWPLIQLGIAVLVVSLLIWLIGAVFTDVSNRDLDPLGLGLKGTSGVLKFWMYLALFAACVGTVVMAVWRNWFGLHKVLMPIAVKIPVIGSVLTNLALSRLTTVLSILLNAGVDAVRSVQMAFSSTGNDYYISRSGLAINQIKKNQSLAKSFAACGVMPQEFIDAIEVGELSGNETESLDALATEYDRRAKTALTALSVASSVAVWLFIAGFIIFLIFRLAMFYINILQNAANGNF